MGKRKLFFGIFIGAVVGGLVSLGDREARGYTKNKLQSASSKTKRYVKNPSETIRNTRIAFNQFSETFADRAEGAINALEQVEETLDKLASKDQKQLDD